MTVTVRVGNGIDVHVLVIGRSLALCGVAIPSATALRLTVPPIRDR